MFNPDAFLDQQIQGANDTQLLPIPVGEYVAVISKIDARPWTSKKDPSKSGIALDVTWDIDDPAVKQLLERDRVTVKQGVMLDLTESGSLDLGKGKNVPLGKLREAVNLNNPGAPFRFSMLEGQMAKIRIEHRIDGEMIYSEVRAVTRIG